MRLRTDIICGDKMIPKIESVVFIRLVTLALLVVLGTLPTKAAKKHVSLIRIPVFFMTDRNLEANKPNSDAVVFGPHRKYIGDCKHELYVGKAYSVVENVDNKPITSELKALGWTEAAPKDKEGDYKATLLTADNYNDVENVFFEEVHQKALLAPDNNIFAFAHGYKNSFASGLHTAAKVAYYAQKAS